jgi:hypothetical protein
MLSSKLGTFKSYDVMLIIASILLNHDLHSLFRVVVVILLCGIVSPFEIFIEIIVGFSHLHPTQQQMSIEHAYESLA